MEIMGNVLIDRFLTVVILLALLGLLLVIFAFLFKIFFKIALMAFTLVTLPFIFVFRGLKMIFTTIVRLYQFFNKQKILNHTN